MPDKMREEVGYLVKGVSDRKHQELAPERFTRFSRITMSARAAYFILRTTAFKQAEDGIAAQVTIEQNKERRVIETTGNGRLDAVSNAIKQYFNVSYELSFYEEHSLTKGSSSKAVAYVGIICQGKTFWGVGIDADIIKASIEALTVAVNKLEEIGNSNTCKDARMIEIMNYIQENYIDITLDDLAEKFFLSKPYISKYIRKNPASHLENW